MGGTKRARHIRCLSDRKERGDSSHDAGAVLHELPPAEWSWILEKGSQAALVISTLEALAVLLSLMFSSVMYGAAGGLVFTRFPRGPITVARWQRCRSL